MRDMVEQHLEEIRELLVMQQMTISCEDLSDIADIFFAKSKEIASLLIRIAEMRQRAN